MFDSRLRIGYRSLLYLRGEPIPMTTVVTQEILPEPEPQKLVKIKRKAKAEAGSWSQPEAEKPKKKAKKVSKKAVPKKKAAPASGKKARGRGIRKDGKPRRSPGTNPPRDSKAAGYGKKVAAARKKKEMTQGDLARKIGVSQPGIANIERGVVGASDVMKNKIAKALGLAA
jgi:ribosome-binding protein aMBF1 (putative translation factor)